MVKTRASPSFLRSACWILHFTNSGNGPLSNKKFPARIWQRLDNFYWCRLIPEMLPILYIFEGSFCRNMYIQKIFRMTNNNYYIMYDFNISSQCLTLSQRPHKLFCPFSAKHGLSDWGCHFWSSCDWKWLLNPMAQIQDGRNENTLDRNIFWVSTRTSHDVLILMFSTSLWQCKVNVGCICWIAVRRKGLIFLKIFIPEFLES